MTQTPAKRITSRGDAIDHTPTSAVVAGDVVVVGSIPFVATQAIAANVVGSIASEGVFDVPKTADVFTAGDAVYWNASETDVGSNTGAADNSTGNIMGVCVLNAANTATHVRTKLTAAKRTTTIGGAVTASDITGEDSSLAVTGLAGNAGAGGAIAGAGGAGDGNAAGGAVSWTGGEGAGTGDGGAASLVGGQSGEGASANGGAVVLTGGTAVNATTGAGGAIAITGGAGPLLANAGGAVTIMSGAGDATNGTDGAILIDGPGTGATGGAITIGTNAASLTLGVMPRFPVAAVVAAGGNIATANACSEGINIVSAADNAKGVQLPSCVDGATVIIVSQTTDKTLKIYPPLGKQINGAGANNAITLAANGITVLVSEGTNAYYGGLSAGIMS